MASTHSDTASTEGLRHAPPVPIDGASAERLAQAAVTSTDVEAAAGPGADGGASAKSANAAIVREESHDCPDGAQQRLPQENEQRRQQQQQQQQQQEKQQEKQQESQREGNHTPVFNEKIDASIAAPETVVLPRACTFSSTLTTLTAASSSFGLFSVAPACDIPESAPPDRVTLVKAAKGDGYVPQDNKLKNNLYRVVGFLELANAGDFAANVWNQYPVPVYATVLMAIGATFAGIMSVLALLDSRRAWRNVQFLRNQQRELKEARASRAAKSQPTRDLDVLLSVVYRELGTEAVSRCGLNMFMGVGAVLISVGTYLAIAGANDGIFLASNLLSGYIGNTPIALFGTVNTFWACYIFFKAQGHINAAAKAIPGTRAMALVKRRSRNVQIYSSINGIATIAGGAGSLITATRWWGYVILIPVILASLFCNYWWRTRAGYARRDLVPSGVSIMNADELSTALEFAARAGVMIKEQKKTPINSFVSDPTSLPSILAFIQKHELFEPFCERLVKDAVLRTDLGYPNNPAEIEIQIPSLLALPKERHPAVIQVAHDTVRKVGSRHFKYRERYAAELLGTYLVISKHEEKQRTKARCQVEKLGRR
ncbi:integral membrane [Trichoderma cornu-damae]|uniref:Integral membrane n=1 Tax=Trichoderma cornu-damae TaxID=654480 RepID=A0A9P8TRQ0_9HYPO|nr:integral membrane [Trichoderma cornu-damae]